MAKRGSIEQTSDGVQLEITRRLDASPEEVWSALTERDALEGWLGLMQYEPEVGSSLTIDFGDGVAVYGEVVAFEPPRSFSFTWSAVEDVKGASLVRFELHPDGSGTTLVLTHSRQPSAMARDTAAGWHAHMELLIGFLAGKTPDWDDVYPSARKAYADLVEGLR